jgi:hypothetical protein
VRAAAGETAESGGGGGGGRCWCRSEPRHAQIAHFEPKRSNLQYKQNQYTFA